MSTTKVSILMPTYEPQALHLRIAIESALKQTFQDFTLLVHDDASIVNVEDIVRPYLEDKRVRFVRSPVRRGIGGNWNACLALIDAPYMQFLFQDDMWEKTYLERVVGVMDRDEKIGLVSAHHRYLNDDDISSEIYDNVSDVRRTIAEGKHDGPTFLREWLRRGLHPNIIGEPPFVLLRTSLVKDTGLFDCSLRQGLDVEYWVRCLWRADWWFVKESLGTFRVHEDAASLKNEESGRGLFDRFVILAHAAKIVPEADRPSARAALDEQFLKMAKKFWNRAKTKHKPGARKKKSLGPLLAFASRHPLLLITTALRALAKSRKTS